MVTSELRSQVDSDAFWSNLHLFAGCSVGEVEKYFAPKCRSSSIFPIYKRIDSHCFLSWLTYWLKKHDSRVAIKLTARNISGENVGQLWRPMTRYVSFNFNVDEFDYFASSDDGFCGSIEIEVFSQTAPMYTFPAVSLFYEDSSSSSVVHSCIRTYNLGEKNTDYAIDFPQTGFDVVIGEAKKNYICFYGGTKLEYMLSLSLELDGNILTKELEIENKRYGQQHIIFVEDLFSVAGENITAKVSIGHNLDVFPRFYVGVAQQNVVPTLTHTFFDTSERVLNQQFTDHLPLRAKNISAEKYFDSAMIVPLLPHGGFNTCLRTYAQNLEFAGEIVFKVLSCGGDLIHQRVLSGDEVMFWNKNQSLDLSRECRALGLSPQQNYNLFFGFDGSASSFPKRFKLGLNVSKITSKIGTNICFAPLVQTDGTLDKPFTRRWFPLGGKSNFIGTLHLTDFAKKTELEPKSVTLEFINTKGETIVRQCDMFLNHSLYIDPVEDVELNQLLSGELGWCLVTASSYHVDAYFFSTKCDQVGGDHAF